MPAGSSGATQLCELTGRAEVWSCLPQFKGQSAAFFFVQQYQGYFRQKRRIAGVHQVQRQVSTFIGHQFAPYTADLNRLLQVRANGKVNGCHRFTQRLVGDSVKGFKDHLPVVRSVLRFPRYRYRYCEAGLGSGRQFKFIARTQFQPLMGSVFIACWGSAQAIFYAQQAGNMFSTSKITVFVSGLSWCSALG